MAKVQFNAALTQMRGTVDGLIIKQTPHGAVLSRRPDMSHVRWSPAQKAHRKLMQEAAVHYRQIMADPKAAARSLARAKQAKVPVSSLVMGEFLKRAGEKSTPRTPY